MSEMKCYRVSSTQENGTNAEQKWTTPADADADEARLLLDLFEIGLRSLRRLAEAKPKPLDIFLLCVCGHPLKHHDGDSGPCYKIVSGDGLGTTLCECIRFELPLKAIEREKFEAELDKLIKAR